MRKDDGNDQDTMTLRDRFAMAALTGMLSHYGADSPAPEAKMAYSIADAMLAERAKSMARTREAPNPQCDVAGCMGGPECMFDAPVPVRTAEQERADAVAWLKREFERLEDLAECERSAGRRDDFQAMARACNVIGNGFEQEAHVGAAERAKAGAE